MSNQYQESDRVSYVLLECLPWQGISTFYNNIFLCDVVIVASSILLYSSSYVCISNCWC